jgi:hypothetical protein
MLQDCVIKYVVRRIACCDKVHKECVYMKIGRAFFNFKFIQVLLEKQYKNLNAENNNLFVVS